jgi:hypothetical protein
MTCPVCGSYGVVRVPFFTTEEERVEPTEWDFAVCLCAKGELLRCVTNAGHTVKPLYELWAAQHHIACDHLHLIEHLYGESELQEMFPGGTSPRPQNAAAIIAAGQDIKH